MAVDYFLKIDGVEGESTDAKHKNEIDLESWSWGETQSGSHAAGGGGGAGKVSMQDFNFVMHTNKASPNLLLTCASGKHIAKAVLTCRKAGEEQQEYLIIKFSDLLISSFQTGGSSGSVIPTDQISFNFSKIEYQVLSPECEGRSGRQGRRGLGPQAEQEGLARLRLSRIHAVAPGGRACPVPLSSDARRCARDVRIRLGTDYWHLNRKCASGQSHRSIVGLDLVSVPASAPQPGGIPT